MIIETVIFANKLIFETENGLFSPNGVDRGTLVMLECAQEHLCSGKILDLGCGYGVVGIAIAKALSRSKIVMCDVDPAACCCATKNSQLNNADNICVICSDGFQEFTDRDFSLILSNPPYHTDFAVAKHFIEHSHRRLLIGGKLLVVVKRLDWYKNKMTAVFGGTQVFERDGYYVLLAEKRNLLSRQKQKKTTRKHLKKQL